MGTNVTLAIESKDLSSNEVGIQGFLLGSRPGFSDKSVITRTEALLLECPHLGTLAPLAFAEKGVYSSYPSPTQNGNPMTLKFEKSSEAFLSVLSLVIGADQVGSLDERDFLFGKVKSLPMFGNPSASDFGKLLGRVTDAVYSQLPTEDGAITPAGVNSLLTEAKKMLTPEQQQSLLQVATELSKSDGATAPENSLLVQLRRVFV